MITYITANPSSYVSPAAPLTIFGVDKSIKYLRIQNNSAYQLSINFSGFIVTLSEFWQKDVPIPTGFQGFIIITPTVVILTASHAQAAQLTVQGLNIYDNGGSLDSAIPQQAVTATASGRPLFSAMFGVGVSAGFRQTVNVFNPPNSGVNFTFHSAKAFTSDVSLPTVDLIYTSGADLNLGTAVAAVSHAGTTTPPVSFAHCTAYDQNSGVAVTALIEVQQLEAQLTVDLLNFPDQYALFPGGNLRLEVISGIAGKTVRVTLKWSE